MFLLWPSKNRIWLPENANSNVNIFDIKKSLEERQKVHCRESDFGIMATKKVIHDNRERERPFNINVLKRVLYRQQCLEEYKAEIEKNVESWVYVYEELNACTPSTIPYDISC